MAKGRIPVPKTLNDLKGDPGRRRRKEVEPEPLDGRPAMPHRFRADPVAAREWDEICGILEEMQLLSRADQTAIELYCTTYSLYRDAEEKVKRYGDVILVGKDKSHPTTSPYYTARNKYLDDLRRLLIEFGLTPAARSRMAIKIDEKPADKWANFRIA